MLRTSPGRTRAEPAPYGEHVVSDGKHVAGIVDDGTYIAGTNDSTRYIA